MNSQQRRRERSDIADGTSRCQASLGLDGRSRHRPWALPPPPVLLPYCRAAMSPAVRVRNPRGPGPGGAVVEEEEAAAAVAWRELRGKAAELAAAAEERAILARRIEAALQVRSEWR